MKLADLPRVLVYLFLVKPFTRWVIGFNVAGLKNIEGLGQMILVSNHSSHLDTLIILSSLGLKQALRTHPVAARDYFGKGDWLGNAACRLFNLVTVPRHRISRSDNPLDIMGDVLRRGENILIFPEGSRGEADHMAAFKTGVGHLASHFPEVPLVPLCVSGSGRALPRGALIPVPLWTSVVFAGPVKSGGRPADITAKLEKIIAHALRREQFKPAGEESLPPEEDIPRRPFSIAVAGIDGSGKSACYRSLVENLCRTETVTGVGDTLLFGKKGAVEEINWVPGAFLKGVLHRLAKGAVKFTGYKLLKLAELVMRHRLQDVMTLKFHPRFAVSDGHPLVNIAAWGILAYPKVFNGPLCAEAVGIMIGRDYMTLRQLCFCVRNMPEVILLRVLGGFRLPDALILLEVSPQTAVQRIIARGEKRQMHETHERLEKLQKAYGIVAGILEKDHNVRTHVIRTDGMSAAEVAEEARNQALDMGSGLAM